MSFSQYLGAAFASSIAFGEFCLFRDRQAYRTHVHIFTLPDGRKLSYKEYGDETKKKEKTIVYLHGLVGSRLEYFGRDQKDSYVITIDRPGHGYSDYQANRTYESFANDVVALMDHLHIQQFSVVGWSSGGCYALACGNYISKERLKHVVCVAGDTEWFNAPWKCFTFGHVLIWFFIKYCPILVNVLLFFLTRFGLSLTLLLGLNKLHNRLIQALRIGGISCSNITQEMKMERSSWGFKLEDLKREVVLFHGDKDTMVHPNAAENMQNRIGKDYCKIEWVRNCGHFIVSSHWKQICDSLN